VDLTRCGGQAGSGSPLIWPRAQGWQTTAAPGDRGGRNVGEPLQIAGAPERMRAAAFLPPAPGRHRMGCSPTQPANARELAAVHERRSPPPANQPFDPQAAGAAAGRGASFAAGGWSQCIRASRRPTPLRGPRLEDRRLRLLPHRPRLAWAAGVIEPTGFGDIDLVITTHRADLNRPGI